MKRLFLWLNIVLVLVLVSCNLSIPGGDSSRPSESTATIDAMIQTQLAQLLSTLPTSTPEPPDVQATEPIVPLPSETAEPLPTNTEMPTAEPSATPEPAEPTQTPLVSIPTATPSATPTLNPSFTPAPGDPRARLGSPSSSDPMNNERTWVWPTGSDKFTSVEFKDGYQFLTAVSEVDGWRLANPLDREYGNIYLEADILTQTCEGSDHYGIIFRVPVLRQADQGYLFGLTCDGRYSLRRWDGRVGPKGEMKWLVNWKADPAINPGSNQGNRLGVMAVGKRIFLYVNGKLLTEVQDDTFEKGYFGVFVGSDKTENLTIKVDNMAYWENPNP